MEPSPAWGTLCVFLDPFSRYGRLYDVESRFNWAVAVTGGAVWTVPLPLLVDHFGPCSCRYWWTVLDRAVAVTGGQFWTVQRAELGDRGGT